MLLRLAALFAALTPTTLHAACADSEPNPPAIMIEVRNAMLTGDYEAFVDKGDAAGRIPTPQKLNIVNVLKGAHPDGFRFCEVLLRRDLSQKLFQELSVFSAPGSDWIFLYALGGRIGGQETLLNFKFSNNAAEELSKFR